MNEGERDGGLHGIVLRLRAAGCVFAEEEADLLWAEAAERTAGADVAALGTGSGGGERAGAGAFAAELEQIVAARVSGLPLEQVLGWADFDGMRILTAPGVFVPRRRTELLVRCAAEGIADAPTGSEDAVPPVIVDLCCGTGAVGAAIARRLAMARGADAGGGVSWSGGVRGEGGARGAEVYAADLDGAAVACARRNLPGDRVFEGDLYAALPIRLRGSVDVLAVNAPYVPTAAIATMPPEAREHEARMALDGGGDGLALQRRVVEGAAGWLAPGGRLLIETSEHQAPATEELFAAAGFVTTVHRDDDLDATVVSGSRPTG